MPCRSQLARRASRSCCCTARPTLSVSIISQCSLASAIVLYHPLPVNPGAHLWAHSLALPALALAPPADLDCLHNGAAQAEAFGSAALANLPDFDVRKVGEMRGCVSAADVEMAVGKLSEAELGSAAGVTLVLELPQRMNGGAVRARARGRGMRACGCELSFRKGS